MAPKTVIVIPARNSEKTIENTYREIPAKFRDHVVISDNASTDRTVKIARKLGMKVLLNDVNRGYGGNLKNLFLEARKSRADIVVLLHSDNQYDASKIPALIAPLIRDEADFVVGSRIRGDRAKGMPLFRFVGNRILTFMENACMGTNITDMHSGMMAFSRAVLEKSRFELNSDDYVFHSEFLFQARLHGFRFAEIGIPTRYFKEASSADVKKSFIYGARTLTNLARYLLHKHGIRNYRKFD
ncbi:MAG: glycosyltransferase family 2 protein [Candidatus Aenigmarchaeota archaeon]|nr:glycosyltransferase family 2 protein [Candidatus Aenigmarchaeota archaeon]